MNDFVIVVSRRVRTALCVAASVALASAAICAPRPGKGALVLQTGSDWCVSGEQLRKVFESSAFKSAVGSGYELYVYDDMDNPTDAAKAKNAQVSDFLIRTKRFPAITCYTPSPKLQVFAQIENISGSVTADALAKAIAKAAARKDKAESLFKKAAASKGEAAADLYGQGFDLMASLMGPFHFNDLTTGKRGWNEQWDALMTLDAGDRYGWIKHFELDEYKCVAMVEQVTRTREQTFVDAIKRVPDAHFTPNQKQFVKVMEYALTTDGTDKPLKTSEKKLLKDAFALGRDTFWGQFAMGRLMMDGEKIESKGLPAAPVRPRPSGSIGGIKQTFPLDRVKNTISTIKPNAKLTEAHKLAIARYAALRLIGEKGWKDLVDRPGSAPFVKAFMNDRIWLEDFAWSGTFPSDSNDAWSSAESGPGSGAAAILALESLIFQDDGKWVPQEGGSYADNEGRRFMTALAMVFPQKNEAWLADVLDAYRTTALAGRLHKSAYSQSVWLWRFAVHQGHPTGGCDNMAAQQRHLDKFVNLPCREYGGTCWMIQYRLENCFGDSVHGPLYYKPWAMANEWPKRRYTQIVGGVCGELSKFGSATANAHGLPSTTVGQPGHCAYSRRLPGGRWELNYSVTGHSQMHMCFWNRHPWQYSQAIEGTYSGDREQRLASERLLTLAALAEERRADAKEIEEYYRQACRALHTHYGAWLAYGSWVARSGASLDTTRTWARGCARGMKSGRQPLWDILTPYFERLAKDKGKKALADDLVVFAPLLRQSDSKIEEEADFGEMMKKWTEPLGSDLALLTPVIKASLSAQYGTPDFFSQTLGWGGDLLMRDSGKSETFIKMLCDVVTEKTAGGGKSELDLGPLILSASRSNNIDSFRQIAALQDKLQPFKGGGKPYPENDFTGKLLSSEGLFKTSTTSKWDKPENYARCIDATPSTGNGFHTEKEKAPWAMVMLRGPSEVKGVVIENNCGAQNRHRQVPLELQVSEDGENWKTVHRDTEVRDTYRIDLRTESPRARYVRVRRMPDAKEDVYHFGKFLVYGKKLY